MNKKARSKNTLNPKLPFKWVMIIIMATPPESLTIDITFFINLLIVDVNSKPPKLYDMDKINTEEVMDKLDMF